MTKNLLAVLFNVFSQVAREQRGMVGEVITSYLAVSGAEDVTATYEKVVGHLGEALQAPVVKPTPGAPAASPTSHTMLDLLVIIVPFLPAPAARALFAHASAAEAKLIGSNDPAVQKKSYRILARLLETGKVTLAGAELEAFVARLRDGTEVVSAGARRVRSLSTSPARAFVGPELTSITCRFALRRTASSSSPSSCPASRRTSSTSSLTLRPRPSSAPRRSTRRRATPRSTSSSSWARRWPPAVSSSGLRSRAWTTLRWLTTVSLACSPCCSFGRDH